MGEGCSDRSRREFMKSVGLFASGLATLGSVGSATGKRRSASTGRPRGRGRTGSIPYGQYKALLRKRAREGWSTNKWRKELAERGAKFSYMDSRVHVTRPVRQESATQESVEKPTVSVERMKPVDERQSDSEVGANLMHKEDARLELTYTSGFLDACRHYQPARLNFSWSVKDPYLHSVEKPLDLAIINIDPDQYDWHRGVEYGPWASASEAIDSMGFSHRCAQYNADAHSNRTIGRFGSYMDVPLEPISGSPSTRKIYVDYIARWDKATIESMTIGSGGDISLTFSSESDVWRAETFANESEMDDGKTFKKSFD